MHSIDAWSILYLGENGYETTDNPEVDRMASYDETKVPLNDAEKKAFEIIKTIRKGITTHGVALQEVLRLLGSDYIIPNEDMAKALSAGHDAPAKTTGSEKMAKELAKGNDKKEEKSLTSSQQAYKSILEDRIREVEEKLIRLEKLSKYDLTGHTATLIMGYRIELEKIKTATENLDKREKLDKESEAKIAEIDKAQEALNEDQKALAEEKKSLEQQQKEVTGYWKKRRIARQIKHNERESQLMNVRRVEMREQQKAIMYPKQKVALKRQALISRQEGKVANIVENIEINNTDMEQMLAKGTLFSGIAAAHYDRVGNRYRKKLERSQAILEEMQRADTLKQIRGARRTVLSRQYSDRLGNEMNPAMSQGVSI